jgi:lysophospholipase
MGGHLALRFLQNRADRVGRALLVAPMLGIAGRATMHPLTRQLVVLLRAVGFGSRYIPGGSGYGPGRRRFEGNRLTGDAERFARLHRLIDRHPDLALADPTIAWVAAALRSIEAVNAPGALERLPVPILLALAEQESIVSNAAIEAAAARLPAARLVRFAEARHEILGEIELVRAAFWREVDGFLAATGPVAKQECDDHCARGGNP